MYTYIRRGLSRGGWHPRLSAPPTTCRRVLGWSASARVIFFKSILYGHGTHRDFSQFDLTVGMCCLRPDSGHRWIAVWGGRRVVGLRSLGARWRGRGLIGRQRVGVGRARVREGANAARVGWIFDLEILQLVIRLCNLYVCAI